MLCVRSEQDRVCPYFRHTLPLRLTLPPSGRRIWREERSSLGLMWLRPKISDFDHYRIEALSAVLVVPSRLSRYTDLSGPKPMMTRFAGIWTRSTSSPLRLSTSYTGPPAIASVGIVRIHRFPSLSARVDPAKNGGL